MPPENACRTHDFSRTPREYFEWHNWVEQRYIDGDKQVRCKRCKCWLFEEELNVNKDTPPKLFIDMLKLLEDILDNELHVTGTQRAYYMRHIKDMKHRSGMLVWK